MKTYIQKIKKCGMKIFQSLLSYFWHRREPLIIVFLIFLNFLAILRIFPPSLLLDEQPLYRLDYARHFQNAFTISNILSTDKALLGYDPYFAAGYPIGGIESLNNRATVLFVFMLSYFGIGKVFAFKLFVVICFLSLPIIIYLTARNFGFQKEERILATSLAIIFLYFQQPNFLAFGMFSFLTISFLYLYIFSIFYLFIKFRTVKYFILMTLLSSLILLIHIFSFLCLLISLGSLYFIQFKKLNYRFHLSIVLFIAIICIINFYSIYPAYIHMENISTNFQNVFSKHGIFKIFEDFFFNSTKIASNFIFFSGILGLLLWKTTKKREIYLSFFASFICFFALTYFGKYNNFLTLMGPYRYYHPLIFLLIFPASSSIKYFKQFLFNKYSSKKAYFILSLTILLLAPLILKPLEIILRPQNFFSDARHKNNQKLITWIKENTNTKGRILLEGNDFSANIFYKSHLASLLPIFCKREFIGGPFYTNINKYLVANFNDSLLFNRPVKSYNVEELKYLFQKYNIIWIIAWSEDAINHFNALETYIVKIDAICNFNIYRVKQAPTFFLKGNGIIKAHYNRIWIKEASKGEVVIKYHWLPTFKTDPPLLIEPYTIKNDPIGFIKVKNGKVSNFLIYNSYK